MSGFETSFQQAFLVFFWCKLGFGYLCNKPLLFLYEVDLGTPETKPNQNTFSNPSQPDQSPSCQSHTASIIVYLLLSTPLSFFFFHVEKIFFRSHFDPVDTCLLSEITAPFWTVDVNLLWTLAELPSIIEEEISVFSWTTVPHIHKVQEG